jgi:hypothetical protein
MSVMVVKCLKWFQFRRLFEETVRYLKSVQVSSGNRLKCLFKNRTFSQRSNSLSTVMRDSEKMPLIDSTKSILRWQKKAEFSLFGIRG